MTNRFTIKDPNILCVFLYKMNYCGDMIVHSESKYYTGTYLIYDCQLHQKISVKPQNHIRYLVVFPKQFQSFNVEKNIHSNLAPIY